jgi:hypothetical protein
MMRHVMHDHSPPAVLPPPPRAVEITSRNGCGLAAIRLLFLPHMLAALFLLLLVPARLYVHWFGTPVAAVVDRIQSRTTRKGGHWFDVDLHYDFRGQRFVEEHQTFSTEVGRQTHVGDALDGRAVTVLGHTFMLRRAADVRSTTILFAVVGVFANGLMSIFYYIAWILPIRRRWLAMFGQEARGKVTARKAFYGRTAAYAVSYTFHTADGRQIKAKSSATAAGYSAARIDGDVTVLYNPRRPKHSLAYECSEFIVTGPATIG